MLFSVAAFLKSYVFIYLIVGFVNANRMWKFPPADNCYQFLASLIPPRVKNAFMLKGLCRFIFLGPGPRSYFGSLSLTSVGLCRETTTSSFRIFVLLLRPLTVNPFSLQPTPGFIQSWFSASSLDVRLCSWQF